MKHSYRKYGSRKDDVNRFKFCGYMREVMIHQNQGKVKGRCALNGARCKNQAEVCSECDVYTVFEKKLIEEQTAERRKRYEPYLDNVIGFHDRMGADPSDIEIGVEIEEAVLA